jgi:hypothetical protein
VWRESPTTEHAVKNNITVCCTVVLQCHNSTQRVVQAASSIIVSYNYNSMSGIVAVLQESPTTEHAVTKNAAACCTVVTHCHNSKQLVSKVSIVISLANKRNIMQDFLAVWPQDGINSTVRYAKEHILALMHLTVYSMAGRRTF